jgi:hypothetical protein
MSHDRSDEIRALILKQRIDRFMRYLKKSLSDMKKDPSGIQWGKGNAAFEAAFKEVMEKAETVFSGKNDKPVKLD